MSILHILSGKVSKVNNLRKVAKNDLSAISTILPIGTEIFVLSVIFELFNPDNNILIKYANNITEEDMHFLSCILANHYIFYFKNKIDMDNISEIFQDNFNYKKEKFYALIDSLSKFNEKPESIHPTVKLIIQYGHASYNPILNNKIVAVIINAHSHTNAEINSALKSEYNQ